MEKRDELMAELIVQKSRPLLTLWASQYTLAEVEIYENEVG